MFNKLTTKQSAVLLAAIIGFFGPVLLLVALNVIEWLLGEFQLTIVSFAMLCYIVYRVLHWLNPDNDTEDEEEVLWQ